MRLWLVRWVNLCCCASSLLSLRCLFLLMCHQSWKTPRALNAPKTFLLHKLPSSTFFSLLPRFSLPSFVCFPSAFAQIFSPSSISLNLSLNLSPPMRKICRLTRSQNCACVALTSFVGSWIFYRSSQHKQALWQTHNQSYTHLPDRRNGSWWFISLWWLHVSTLLERPVKRRTKWGKLQQANV